MPRHLRLSNAFFQPPFALRRTALRPSPHPSRSWVSSRGFHATHPRRDIHSALDIVLACPHAVLTSLHSLGLPWYAAIPASAFLVRSLIILPLLQAPLRLAQERLLQITSLRLGRMAALRRQIQEEGDPRLSLSQASFKRRWKKEDALLRRKWACTQTGFFMRVLGQIPVFVIMAETIRRMAGAPVGLLGSVASVLGGKAGSKVAEAEHGVLHTSDATSSSGAEVRENTTQVTLDDAGSLQASSAAPTDVVDTASTAIAQASEKHAWFEPSMAEEGLLWFHDLTTWDSTMNLPFIVAGLMALNMYAPSLSKDATLNVGVTSKGTMIRRVSQTLLLFMAPLLIHVPAGVLWYWASSTLFALLSNLALDQSMRVGPPVVPCKRPAVVLRK